MTKSGYTQYIWKNYLSVLFSLLKLEVRTCSMTISFSVNGGYTQWSQWGSCTVTCGSGQHVRTRTCTNPRPQNGGLNCFQQNMGGETDIGICTVGNCPGKQNDTQQKIIFQIFVTFLRLLPYFCISIARKCSSLYLIFIRLL